MVKERPESGVVVFSLHKPAWATELKTDPASGKCVCGGGCLWNLLPFCLGGELEMWSWAADFVPLELT